MAQKGKTTSGNSGAAAPQAQIPREKAINADLAQYPTVAHEPEASHTEKMGASQGYRLSWNELRLTVETGRRALGSVRL